MGNERTNCDNPEYLSDLRDHLEGELFSQYPDCEDWADNDPRKEPFMRQADDIADRTTGLRLSCAKFSVGIVISGDSIAPDLANPPCMLASDEVCPIAEQVQSLRAEYRGTSS
jgi:hypothetical protein